ncbi:hypothetical protein J7K43_08655 [Candidatus Calescamantes bacterium]|nr:hypothetical protein [Candidatus Calescamantes bacterium]
MPKALVLTVGTTLDPLIKSIEEAFPDEPPSVFLLCGKPFPGQNSSPIEIAKKVYGFVKGKRGEIIHTEIVENPDSFSESIRGAKELIAKAQDYEELIVDITCGTKVLSGSLLHVSLNTYLRTSKVKLRYVSGERRGENGRVLSPSMKIKEDLETVTGQAIEEMVENINLCNYAGALHLAVTLPQTGILGVFRKSVEALAFWDNFQYEKSMKILREISVEVELLKSYRRYSTIELMETIQRLKTIALKHLQEPLYYLKNLCNKNKVKRKCQWEDFYYLIADILENASRCHLRHDFSGSILRSYRALESTIQIRLLQKGINPWEVKGETIPEDVRNRYINLSHNGRIPSRITLNNGVTMLRALGIPWGTEEEKHLQFLQENRNLCFLEHGYLERSEGESEDVLKKTVSLIQGVLEISLSPYLKKVRHFQSHEKGSPLAL